MLRARELYVLGKDLGTTNVLLWNDNDQLIGSVAVEVTHDLDGLKRKLFELFPTEQIDVVCGAALDRAVGLGVERREHGCRAAARTRLSRAGRHGRRGASSSSSSRRRREDRTGGQVINLMQVAGAQQVMLEVKVAEIARTELRAIRCSSTASTSAAAAGTSAA